MSSERNNDLFSATGEKAKMSGLPTRDMMKDDFGLDIPLVSVPLPSKGKVYSEGTPLFEADALDIRPMTAREEDILTSRALIKKGTVITELIKSCLVDKRIDPDDLIAGDRNAIMIALRITGYGSEYSVEVACPDCSNTSKQQFDLTKLPMKLLEEEPLATGQNTFEFELPYTKQIIKFKFLDGKDEASMNKLQERQKKAGSQVSNLITLRYRYQILAVGQVTDKSKIQMFISKMPARDSRALRNHIDKIEPGMEMKNWIDCTMCGEESEVRMPLGASFFWPDAD